VRLKIIISLLFSDALEGPDRGKDVEKENSQRLSLKLLKAGRRLRRNTIPISPTMLSG
jgi:hypothetical protein